MTENLEATGGDLKRFSEAATQLRQELSVARGEVERSSAARQELNARIQKLEEERTGLAARLEVASKQLATQGKTPILPATEVARLTHELVNHFQGGLGDMRVREGELKLKVAFAGVGDKTGLVVPTLDSDPKLKESFQELTVRFDRAVVAESRPPGSALG